MNYSVPDTDQLVAFIGADFAVTYEMDYDISGFEYTAEIIDNKGDTAGAFRVTQDNVLKTIMLDFAGGDADIIEIGKGKYTCKLMQTDIASSFTIPILIIDFSIKA